MSNSEDYENENDLIIYGLFDHLYEKAEKRRNFSVEYELLLQKQNKLLEDLEVMLKKESYGFVEDLYAEILYVKKAETRFYYEQGFKDCINMLKQLQIL